MIKSISATQAPESLVIDTVAMNIVNRIAQGSVQKGELYFHGGLLVDGTLEGLICITDGPLVLMPDGVLSGHITVEGDAYLLGTVKEKTNLSLSALEIKGAVYLASTLTAAANIDASCSYSYEGSSVSGFIRVESNTNRDA